MSEGQWELAELRGPLVKMGRTWLPLCSTGTSEGQHRTELSPRISGSLPNSPLPRNEGSEAAFIILPSRIPSPTLPPFPNMAHQIEVTPPPPGPPSRGSQRCSPCTHKQLIPALLLHTAYTRNPGWFSSGLVPWLKRSLDAAPAVRGVTLCILEHRHTHTPCRGYCAKLSLGIQFVTPYSSSLCYCDK